jgi:tRNA 2-thiouridine synthesizing protein A
MASIGCCCLVSDPDILDARGQKCPLPVLRMEKRLAALPPGAQLVVLATDPIAKVDIPLYCRQNGHAVTLAEETGVLRFDIIKDAAS